MSEQAPVVRVSHIVTAWQGALPPPEALAAYESIVKGAAERLLSLAEEESRDRRKALDKSLDAESRRIARGQYVGAGVALAFLAGAVACAWLGQTAVGVAIAGATIVGIVNALAAGGKPQKQ